MMRWMVLGATVCMLVSCSRETRLPVISAADSISIVNENVAHRMEMDLFFRNDPGSPFVRDTTIAFEGIRWFPVDPYFAVHSILHRYDRPDTVTIMGTKGEERRQLRYGYFEFHLPDDEGKTVRVRLNVYKFTPSDGQRYLLFKDNLSVWFTDRTTGKDTYRVGRYIEIGTEQPDLNHRYSIDFNKAFNPYCAYSSLYSCAIPDKEDYIDLALRVGERTYHQDHGSTQTLSNH
jgi:uncharacterized protein